MFFPPPADLKPASLFGNQEAWRIAFVRQPYGRWGGGHCGVQASLLRLVPFSPHIQFWQRTAHGFFLAKYLQYGQSPLFRNSRLLLSHVASWRLDGGYFFICPATIHLTQLIPTGIAAAMAARLPAGMCMWRFPDGCEEECHFTGQSGVGH